MNDAADSPIVTAGSDNQWTIGVGLSRAFTVNF
jgi:outer membrane scaffolding protein for murein synthesis (MipA/OmpV family)